ncbi:hypothetical protein DMUE_0899 [Dictyocoela muelleri]|nr:hypothetical protein DMUE_0899 [Dictyocoela muelleri]
MLRESGLKRKIIHKRSNIILKYSHKNLKRKYCIQITMLRKKKLFFDESGFNLLTSINYKYLIPIVNPVSYHSKSREHFISLCAIMSITDIEYYKIIDGGYDQNIFNNFIREIAALGIFVKNTVLVMDNVRFNKCGLLMLYY